MSKWQNDEIVSWYELADKEKVTQKGMHHGINPKYSIILMSQRSGAPYNDKIHSDGVTIEYEGHDMPKDYAKVLDQPKLLPSGKLTENGKFIKAIEYYKNKKSLAEKVMVYEKIIPNRWSIKGLFDLIDYKIENDGKRNVFKFILRLSEDNTVNNNFSKNYNIEKQSRLIPSAVKQEVYIRDKGRCVICGSDKNLHFDHELPFSKGGTSLSASNIRILCQKCNLAKSDKIE